jgi:hypothetical protein
MHAVDSFEMTRSKFITLFDLAHPRPKLATPGPIIFLVSFLPSRSFDAVFRNTAVLL